MSYGASEMNPMKCRCNSCANNLNGKHARSSYSRRPWMPKEPKSKAIKEGELSLEGALFLAFCSGISIGVVVASIFFEAYS